MSGGSMEYLYIRIQEYACMLEDAELISLANDFADLLHDCEWMHSGDIGEGNYNLSVSKFKRKWLHTEPEQRIAELINSKVESLRRDMLKMLGLAPYCKDCNFFEGEEESYGNCVHCKGYMKHGYDDVCEKFLPNGE